MKALAAMEAAAPNLAKDDPGAYVAHLLFSALGLRNIEIVNARTHWISDGSIGIINRPGATCSLAMISVIWAVKELMNTNPSSQRSKP